MALRGERTFVGFGFGAIQGGLFLAEAHRSGGFRRLVVAEVVPETVRLLEAAGGRFSINVAEPDRVELVELGPVEAQDPGRPEGRERIIAALAEAAEVATAVPSVSHYTSGGPAAIHRLLAEGLTRGARAGRGPVLVYAAENDNRAAEILEEAVLAEVEPSARAAVRRRTRFLNTVIGKMSGVVTDPRDLQARGLAPFVPGGDRAFLVESFNRILISAVKLEPGDPLWSGFRRGLQVFEEKEELLPFEEAKLYGHNAVHAAAAYLAALVGLKRIAELRTRPDLLSFLRAAFIEESGRALVESYRGIDPLFTPEGFRAYAEDLLSRMTNPHLGDTVERVGRDVRRKLGWNDRLVGTIRMALRAGIAPHRFGFAAGCALLALERGLADPARPAAPFLEEIWGEPAPASERPAVLALIEGGRRALLAWMRAGFPPLE
jgi:mannitol-1-phosphate 5-dehydrogenase